MEIVLLLTLILANGGFAMSEIALVSARRTRLGALARAGDRAAALALKLREEPTRFLSAIQIGITSIGILYGVVGEAVLARPLAASLRTLGLEAAVSEVGATALVVVVITYVSIVLGELVPKRLGQLDPEHIACLVARPMNALAFVTRPFVHLLAGSTALVLRLTGHRETAVPHVTEDDIHALLAEGSESGVIMQREHEMVRNVLRLDDRPLGSLMVSRGRIVWLDATRPIAESLALVTGSPHSRYPVCRGGFQQVLGTISAKDLLGQTLRGEAVDLAAGLRPPTFVPETLSGMALLERFQTSGDAMVFVLDEYGEVQGLVTLHDVVEILTGELSRRGGEEAGAVRREDGSWLLDGLLPIIELKELLGIRAASEDEQGRYHTLSGLLMSLLGHLPSAGEVATWEGWRLEVVDLDGRRIDKVLASPLRAPLSRTKPGQTNSLATRDEDAAPGGEVR